jgi:hypothetical protein
MPSPHYVSHYHYNIKAPIPTAKAPTTAPALTLILSAAPEAVEEAPVPEFVPLAEAFPEVEASSFSSSTPPTPVAFLHTSLASNLAVLEKVISAHYSHFKSVFDISGCGVVGTYIIKSSPRM